MTRPLSPHPVSSFDPRLLQRLLEALNRPVIYEARRVDAEGNPDKVVFDFDVKRFSKLRRLIHSFRNSMRVEHHPLYPQVANIECVLDPKHGTLTLRPRQYDLDDLLGPPVEGQPAMGEGAPSQLGDLSDELASLAEHEEED